MKTKLLRTALTKDPSLSPLLDFLRLLEEIRVRMRRARFKVQRRLGLELPGMGKPGALGRRPYPPGENGNKRRKYSDFALRMEEKQKLRNHYSLREKQLRRFIRDAKTGRGVAWTDKLIGLLECRLDNIVFRLGFAPSLRAARQLIRHGHVMVNKKKLDIPSAVLNKGDKISLKDKAYEGQTFLHGEKSPRLELPDFLQKEEAESGKPIGVLLSLPGREHIPFSFDAGLFTEYYAARKV